jgi:hypothetical protein
MADLGLLQAWDMWFDNVQVNQHTLYGASILALGRAGKVVSFIAGMTVVLDLIGPKRIRELAGTRVRTVWGILLRVYAAGTGIALVLIIIGLLPRGTPTIVLLFANLAALPAIPLIAAYVVYGVANALANERWEPIIRWLAVMLLVLGFHFDLLAS